MKRSLKAIHPAQTEGEGDGFGTRRDKEIGATLQRNAWDKNTRLLTPIFTSISRPLCSEIRKRGEMGRTSANRAVASSRVAETEEAVKTFDSFVEMSCTEWGSASEKMLEYS